MKENIFERVIAIWKPDFLKKFKDEKKIGRSWGFWFFWNTVFTIAATLYVVGSLSGVKDVIEDEFPDGKFIVEDGVLRTEGVKDPYKTELDDGYMLIIDTKGEKYDEDILDEYSDGLFIDSERIISKQNDYKTQEFTFDKLDGDTELSKEKIVDWMEDHKVFLYGMALLGIFVILWLLYTLLRLITALWWAFIIWIVAMVTGVKEYQDFGRCYLAILHLYFVHLVLVGGILILLLGVVPWYISWLVFGVFIGLNFWQLKQEDAVPSPVAKEEEEEKMKDKK
jgi:hypothetical protein